MSYTDAEMMMATQIAYLNSRNQDKGKTVGEVVDSILYQYGTYDSSTGTYVMREGVTGVQEGQFNTALNILRLSEQNNTDSWRYWKVVDSCDCEDLSGYYGCLIDTGDGNAIVGCRGSESTDLWQRIKDWVIADFMRLNNPLTIQQANATLYVQYLWEKYQNEYDSFSFTGHSLGGSLATHAAITAPEGMQEKTDAVISFDGPGFSDEYLFVHSGKIQKIANKIRHYEWSWCGSLLNQPEGIDNRVIQASDDESQDSALTKRFYRHATYNVKFDNDGNVMDGTRGDLQLILGPVSRLLENDSPCYLQIFHSKYVSLVVSGEYEIHFGEISRMADDLDEVQHRMRQIADQVREVRRTLPYDSVSAFYYKNCLTLMASALDSEGRKAKNISKTADQALTVYSKGDQNVVALF